MIDIDNAKRRFRLTIELLEDLHTGCGTGSGVVDRALARDLDGRPVIPRSHLQGIWRDNGDRLREIGRIGKSDWITLFGKPGGERGCVIAPELKPIDDSDPENARPASPESLAWDATARRAGSRVPDDHSLRRTEYLPAGTILAGIGYLGSDDKALIQAFAQVLRFTDRLGSERSRGSGLIRVDFQWLDANAVLTPEGDDRIGTGLRLLLRAVAPVCIPSTGFPGNIIPSETHIPGRMLFGALAAWALGQGQRPDTLFERRVQVGPAYPLPAGKAPEHTRELATLQVLPMPLCLYTPKPGPCDHSIWPHWAGQSKADTNAGPRFIDKLSSVPDGDTKGEEARDKTRSKRPKPHAYLFRTDTGASCWSAFTAPLGLRMRNKRGTSLKDIQESETALFAVEQIPADTWFVADLRADRRDTLEALRDTLSGLLDAGGSTGDPLRIGRGGAPVEVVGWCTLTDSGSTRSGAVGAGKDTNPIDVLRVTLTTDSIIRDPRTMGFHAQLSAEAIYDALALTRPDLSKTRQRCFSDSQRYVGFNAASGLPMTPKTAIRRGSTLLIEGPHTAELYSKLRGRGPIGERQWEGCGRFLLGFAPAADAIGELSATAVDQGRAAHLKRIAQREGLLARAEEFAEQRQQAAGLTRTQIGNLRGLVAALPPNATIEKLSEDLETYRKRVTKRRDGDQWEALFEGDDGLIPTLKDACTDSERVKDHADLFLRVLRREAKKDRETEPKDTNGAAR